MLPPVDSLVLSLFFLAILLTIIFTSIDNLFYRLQKRLPRRFIQPGKIVPPPAPGHNSRIKNFAVHALYILLIFSIAMIPLMTNLNGTILNANFIVSELNKLSVRTALTELFPQDLTGPQQYKTSTVDNTFKILGPWLKSQADQIILQIYPYLLGETDSLSVSVPLIVLQDTLKSNLEQAVSESPPPGFSNYSAEQKNMYLDETYRSLFSHIPAAMQISSGTSTAIPLNDVRNAISIFKVISLLFIPLVFAICLGIIFLTK